MTLKEIENILIEYGLKFNQSDNNIIVKDNIFMDGYDIFMTVCKHSTSKNGNSITFYPDIMDDELHNNYCYALTTMMKNTNLDEDFETTYCCGYSGEYDITEKILKEYAERLLKNIKLWKMNKKIKGIEKDFQ